MLKNKWLAGVLCVLGVAALVGGGYIAWNMRPVSMPETAEEAVAVINSARFGYLPDYRQEEYMERTRRLVRETEDADQRRALREAIGGSEQARDAMMRMWQQRMIDQALAMAAMSDAEKQAHLQEQAQQWQRRRSNNDQNQQRTERPQRPERSEAEQAERRERMRNRMEDHFQSGNPQMGGIMGEWWRQRREARERSGVQNR